MGYDEDKKGVILEKKNHISIESQKQTLKLIGLKPLGNF